MRLASIVSRRRGPEPAPEAPIFEPAIESAIEPVDPTQEAVDAAVAAAVRSAGILTAADAPPDIAARAESHATETTTVAPSGRLQQARDRVRALDAALEILRGRGHADMGRVRQELSHGDVDAMVDAWTSHAIGLYLDSELGRDGTEVHELRKMLIGELVRVIWSDPHAALASLGDGPDAAFVRHFADEALTPTANVFDHRGQPAKSRMPSLSVSQTLPRR